MNKKIMLVAVVCLATATGIFAQVSTTVQITNPASIARPDERIVFTQQEITKQLRSTPAFISISHGTEQLPVQHIDNDLDGQWDEVVFLYSFKANEKASFSIVGVTGNTAPVIQRAHVRLRKKNADDSFAASIASETMPLRNPPTDFSKQPLPVYLTEGPAWENDKVAFRLYFDTRNNKDIYAKTTSAMMMDTVGVNHKVSYHNLADWGMDVLHVVKSLGAGALALSVPRPGFHDTLIRLGGNNITKTVYQQIADGPLLAKFTMNYDWTVSNKPVQVKEEISIWGGQHFYDSKVTVTGAPAGAKLVAGIADFYENTFDTVQKGNAVIAFSYGTQSENKDNLGLAILVDKKHFAKADSVNKSNTDINETYIVSQNITGNKPLYYRFYSGWERTDKRFTTFQLYKHFLQEEAVKYSNPLQVKWIQ